MLGNCNVPKPKKKKRNEASHLTFYFTSYITVTVGGPREEETQPPLPGRPGGGNGVHCGEKGKGHEKRRLFDGRV